jgi:hypothetical protein
MAARTDAHRALKTNACLFNMPGFLKMTATIALAPYNLSVATLQEACPALRDTVPWHADCTDGAARPYWAFAAEDVPY